ncbi:hypothetical protein SAMN05192552_101610 [Natrinema hispanicum]|uniref:DUF8121 domain-containing protein n=2 Tax=Natrinema hispanicum TaxID=392421 RepID=A0A1G6T376_9EURY|nr:hypothetical protein SAMN05192552_101610 [Natrinema hispanicum]SEU00334.1 hypothetical protein SAMN04488694_12523 [Natrinema hispanicum]
MNRRGYLAAVCSTGVVTMAGCSQIRSEQTLSDPTVHADSSGRKTLVFATSNGDVGKFGVNGRVDAGIIDAPLEIWHREGTAVKSIKLRVWMPEVATESPPKVAIVSPVEGDRSPPPSVALYTPDRAFGTVIEVSDLNDLADETISILNLLVKPVAETATKLNIHTTIELTSSGVLERDYTLNGELQLTYSELNH